MTYSGLLSSAQSQDAIRVSLEVQEGILRASEPGGSSWDITLERVRLIRWSGDELQLELAGEAVRFVPEDPDAALRELVPALRSREQTPPPPTRHPSGTSAGLIVDLTDSGPDSPPVPGRPTSPTEPLLPATVWPDVPQVTPRSRSSRRPPVRRAVIWGAVALAIAAGTLIFGSRGSDEGPRDRAREALDRAGLSSVLVVVDDGTATLTGTVDGIDESQAAAAAVAVVDGVDDVVNDIEVAEVLPRPPTPATTVTEGPAAQGSAVALAALGIAGAVVETEGSLVVVSGTVASEAERRMAAAALLGVEGVEQVDNRLTVVPIPDETVSASVRTALDESGFEAVTATVENGIATLTGVVPLDVLDRGFFQYSDRAEGVVAEQEGVAGIRNRLQLTGDAATLRSQLRSLTEGAPIIFGLGQSALTETSRATLDAAAAVIQGQPGLRVLIAGHTDTTGSAGFNEQLSQERADAVRRYLIDQGIADNRLAVVAYGELFPSLPGAEPLDRRVEFEVAG